MLFIIALVAILGLAAVAIDVGTVYFAYEQLQTQTQAAALAGGAVMSNDGETEQEAEATATDYSGSSSDANAGNSSLITNIHATATTKCLTSSAAVAAGVPSCSAYSIGQNAMQVTETATVPTTFARALGYNSFAISVTALASAKGGFNGPYNVAIVVDTTSSMNTEDGGTNCSGTRVQCALQGIQTLLATLSPCPGGLTSCGSASASSVEVPGPGKNPGSSTELGNETAHNVSNSVDEVALFTFPGLSSIAQTAADYNCAGSNPGITSYNGYFNPNNCTGNGTPASCCSGKNEGPNCASTTIPPIYEVVPFSSDYRSSDTATSLSTSSDLVIATGGGSCQGVQAPGGEKTFYAGVIYTAQAALAAAQSAKSNSKNVMILLSDGDASAPSGNPPGNTEGMAEPTSDPSWAFSGSAECQQAVSAAQYAASEGTTVYSVAYGSESSGCTSGDTLTPICTMQEIANSPNGSGSYVQNNSNFFTDATSTTTGCAASARSTSSLNQIFKQIGSDLTVARLLPAGTT